MIFQILFMDADDTIFDFAAAQKAAFYNTFESQGLAITDEIYLLYNEINRSQWQKLERGETVKERLIYERFEELFERTGIKGDVVKTEDIYQYSLGNYAFYLPGAKEGMEILSKKYDIFIITNGTAKTQKSRIKISGLDKYVKDVYVSEDVGYNKPDIRYYDYCLEKSGAKRENILCIGDSLTSDILGGITAGIKTMWCNFKNEKTDVKKIDYVVYSWDDILNILG